MLALVGLTLALVGEGFAYVGCPLTLARGLGGFRWCLALAVHALKNALVQCGPARFEGADSRLSRCLAAVFALQLWVTAADRQSSWRMPRVWHGRSDPRRGLPRVSGRREASFLISCGVLRPSALRALLPHGDVHGAVAGEGVAVP